MQIISSAKIAELNYEMNVEREMAILQLLAHPGIARLISSFRWASLCVALCRYVAVFVHFLGKSPTP
jgi:hypothetical protein